MSVEREVFRQAKASGFRAAESFRKTVLKEVVEYECGAVSRHSSENDRFSVRVFRDAGLPYGFSISSPDRTSVKDSFRLLGGSFLNNRGRSFVEKLPSEAGESAVDIYDSNWRDKYENIFSGLVDTVMMRAAAFRGMNVSKIRCEAREEKKYIENSRGLSAKYKKTIFSLSIATEMNGGFIETREDRVFADMLDPVRLVSRSYNLISSLQGEADINSKDRFFIFTPEAASMILREFAEDFVAGVCENKARINYPPVITLLDNPVAQGLCGSSPFDDEGIASGETVLIDKGFPAGKICDIKSGDELGVESTGNGYRSERSIFPSPRFTNLYLKPSVLSQQMLMDKAAKGIFVSLIRPKYREGDKMTFSVCGFRFERGEITTPLRFYLRTSMDSFFINTHMVSREIRFFNNIYNTGSPYVFTEGRIDESGVAEI